MDTKGTLALLLSSLRILCRYFHYDEGECGISETHWDEVGEAAHITCNCDGEISRCDLPEKFHKFL